jgi:hypothetical protein
VDSLEASGTLPRKKDAYLTLGIYARHNKCMCWVEKAMRRDYLQDMAC